MKIYIRRVPASLANEIYFVNEPSRDFKKGDIIQFLNVKENGEVIVTEKKHEYGMILDMKPTMILLESETRELIAAFVEHARQEGLKFNTESKAEGKLEATEKHLEDMRKLVFKEF